MARYGDLDAVKLKVQRYLIPNTDDVGMVDAAVAERWFLKLLDEAPTADVVPKSEVAKEFTCFVGDPHKVDHCPYLDEIEKAKTGAAREIFDKIEKQLARYSHIHRYAEEAKEVTEEYADGSPVEMTSVWDACRLEHNGYDDYETMCKLQDNIGNIEKSRLLKEIEGDIDDFKKKYTEEKS